MAEWMDDMVIAGIVKSSMIDFPEHISCVLFVPGCNYNCYYCHNRQLLDFSYTRIEHNKVMDFLIKRSGLLDGVVVSGGEPTLQPDLTEFLLSVKRFGYKVKLDTNGSSPEVVAKLLAANACDYYAIDYKAPSSKYCDVCGNNADAKTVLNTVQLLIEANAAFEVRTTILPQFDKNDIACMAKELPVVPRYVLNRYRVPENHIDIVKSSMGQPLQSLTNQICADFARKYQPNISA